jgi:hypothetical protein
MKKNIILSLITAAIFTACSGGGSPPDFQKAKLQAFIPQGAAASTLGHFDLTVEQMAKTFLDRAPGKWSKLSDTEYMLTLDSEDRVTKARSRMQLVFDKRPELKGDVLMSRVVIDGQDSSQEEIFQFMAARGSQQKAP